MMVSHVDMPLVEDSPIDVSASCCQDREEPRSIPKAITAELALVFGDGRLVEAMEGGLAIGLGALVAHLKINLWV
jgi:hypothetical protein